MKTFVEGQAVTITIPFERDGEPFVPDANSVTYDLRGQDGSLLQTGVAIPNVIGSSTELVIAQTYNAISPPYEFEKRMMVIYATVGGQPWQSRITYRLCVWLNFTASNDDVRGFIGIGKGELPDCDIDLISAYWDCANFMDTDTTTFFENALVSGNENERQANRAIIAQSVLLLMSSLQARVSQLETDGNMEAQRFPINFGDLEDRASNQLSRAINIITSRQIVNPLSAVYVPTRDPMFPRRNWFYR